MRMPLLPRRVLFVLAVTMACGSLGCPADDGKGTPCAPEFTVGQRLSLRLDAPYDAKSDYLFDGAILPDDLSPSAPSCQGIDGLAPTAPLTFLLRTQLSAATYECGPWFADLKPEFVVEPHVVVTTIPSHANVTIAASFAEGTFADRQVFATRVLFSPLGDARAVLVPRQLPPLVVTRKLVTDHNQERACFDAWIAHWETAP